jgi:hypothetical protein
MESGNSKVLLGSMEMGTVYANWGRRRRPNTLILRETYHPSGGTYPRVMGLFQTKILYGPDGIQSSGAEGLVKVLAYDNKSRAGQ